MIPVSAARQGRFDADSRARAERYGVPYERVDLRAVLAKTGCKCYLCRRPLTPELFEADHVKPISRGGWHTLANLAPACRPCNRRKLATPPPSDIPPAYVRTIVRALWRLGIASAIETRAGSRGIIDGPQAWTVVLRIAPDVAPKAMGTADVLSFALGVDVRMTRVNRCIGVRIPRPSPCIVPLRAMPAARGVWVPLGYDDLGRPAWADLRTHYLGAGASGAGKSEALRAIVRALALGNAPADLRMMLCDPSGKGRALAPFSRLQHLIAPLALTPRDSHAAIAYFERELARRGKAGETGPPWVLIVDELLDLDDSTALFRLARLGRELGLHVAAAMQAERAADLDMRAAAQFGTRACFRVAPNDGHTSRMMVGDGRAIELRHSGLAWIHTPTALREVRVAHAPPGDACWTAPNWLACMTDKAPDALPLGPGNRTAHARIEPGADVIPADVEAWAIEESKRAGRPVGINKIQDRAGIGSKKARRWQEQLSARLAAMGDAIIPPCHHAERSTG